LYEYFYKDDNLSFFFTDKPEGEKSKQEIIEKFTARHS